MKIERDSAGMPVKITMRKPADMHQHLRQGAMLKLVMPMVAKRFSTAIIMPNTVPPITTYKMAGIYLVEICQVRDESGYKYFRPLMTMYLTDTLEPKEVEGALQHKVVFGIKYYPRGLTTNSESGVKDPSSLWTRGTKPYEVLRVLAENNGVLLLHAADGFASASWGAGVRSYRVGDELDPFDQELHFILNTLPRIREAHPDLKISVEHLSTMHGVEYMRKHGGKKLGCSLTAQHLLLDRRDVFRNGFRPDRTWWPIIQPKEHRDELRRFASEGHEFVWLGSDSAPHPVGKKYAACCVGGVLMAHAGIELYVEAFEDMERLDIFENFACVNGPAFYGIKPSDIEITLVREEWGVTRPFYTDPTPPSEFTKEWSDETVIPFRLGEKVRWKLVD